MNVVKPGLAPMRNVPLLVKMPVPKLTVPPVEKTPLLVKEALETRLNVAPWLILMVPVLVANLASVLSVPALAPRVPLLVNEEPVPLSWMVVVPLAVLAKMPSLITVTAL